MLAQIFSFGQLPSALSRHVTLLAHYSPAVLSWECVKEWVNPNPLQAFLDLTDKQNREFLCALAPAACMWYTSIFARDVVP
jgi:hypothetical protein